jgi:DNA-binding HxlR family transcriptional regulator
LSKLCYTRVMKITNPLHSKQPHDHCPLDRIIRLIGDTWTLMIVYTLLSGSKRFGELFDALGNVSPKTVSQRLKMLEEERIVERRAYAEIPPRVEYNLTEKGMALADILNAMRAFQDRYLSDPQ